MNRRQFFKSIFPTAAALVIPGLALAACAPKRFPWPGSTLAEAAREFMPLSTAHPWGPRSMPLVDALLDAGRALDEQEIPDVGREVYLSTRQIAQLNTELGWGPECYYQIKTNGVSCGMIDRFSIHWRDDRWGHISFGVWHGGRRAPTKAPPKR